MRLPDSIETELGFCRDQRHALIPDRELYLLATKCAGLVVPAPNFSVPVLFDRIFNALQKNEPFSLVRVGNGEGNAVAMAHESPDEFTVKTFFTEFNSQNYLPVPLAVAQSFCRRVKEAILAADMIGFRSFRGDELEIIDRSISEENSYAALGITYARSYMTEWLQRGLLQTKILTSAWIHLDLLPYLEELIGYSRRIVVVSGRTQLQEHFKRRLGDRLEHFVPVPVQGAQPSTLESSHYGKFEETIDFLQQHSNGRLVLVGAGLFGKIYCAEAKRAGGVALDIGSVFDVLSGLSTRPVFNSYDLSGRSWL